MQELDSRLKMYTDLTTGIPFVTIQAACRDYQAMRDWKDEIEFHLKLLNAQIDKARHELLPVKFKEADVTSITVDGYRFVISHTVRASIASDKKPEAYEWLRNNELGELITETVNASTLSAEAKRIMEDGEELPEDLFKVATVPNVSITKSK